jgi:prefoldin subunit 5
MRVILGICSVVSFAFPVFADPQLGEKSEKAPAVKKNFEKSIAEASAKISNLEKTKAELAQKIYDSQRNVTNAEKTMKNAQNVSGGTPLTDKQRGVFLKAHADYLKTNSEFEPALTKAKADLAKVDQELEGLQQTVKVEKAEKFSGDIQSKTADLYNEAQNTVLQNRLRTADLRSDFMELDIKKLRVEATLDDMEKLYDKSVLGAYLQDKFGQLLNSQSICSAVKRCAVSDPKKIDPEKIRQELFPESKEVRSDYYDKVNKKQATPVQ